jgi:hypothetical protein
MYHEFLMPYIKLMSIVNKHLNYAQALVTLLALCWDLSTWCALHLVPLYGSAHLRGISAFFK